MTIYFLLNIKITSEKFFKIIAFSLCLIFCVVSIFNSIKFLGPKDEYDYSLEAKNIIQNITDNQKILIVDMRSNGIEATMLRYHLDGIIEADYVSPLHYKSGVTKSIVQSWLDKYTFIYVYFGNTGVLSLLSDSAKYHSTKVVYGPRNRS